MPFTVPSLRLTAYTSIAAIHARMAIVRRIDLFASLSATLILAYAFAFLWRALYENDVVSAEVTLGQMTTYAVIGVGLAAAVLSYMTYRVQHRIELGEVLMDLTRPIHWQSSLMAEFLGESTARALLVATPGVLLSAIYLDVGPPASVMAALAFIPSVFMGVVITFGIQFLVIQLAFRLVQVTGIEVGVWAIRHLLSGAFVPLWLFPSWFGGVLAYSPFPSIHFAPLGIYVGFLEGADIPIWLGRQLLWVVLLTALGAYLSKRSILRMTVQGG